MKIYWENHVSIKDWVITVIEYAENKDFQAKRVILDLLKPENIRPCGLVHIMHLMQLMALIDRRCMLETKQ